MRPLQALAFLLLLSAPISALSLNDFLAPYLLPGERPVAEDFSIGGSNYALVRIAGKPSFLLSEKEGEFGFVQDAGQIQEALRSKTLEEMQLTESLDASLLLVREFNDSRLLGERECRRQTGTDRFPCTDKDSCIVACRSVPNCQTALSYSLESMNDLQAWLVLSSSLDTLVADAETANAAASSALESSFGTGPVDALLEKEYNIQAVAHDISENSLFNCGPVGKCFCSYTFNHTPLRTSIETLLRVRSNLTLLQTLPSLSSSIANTTAQRTSIKDEGELYALVLFESDAKLGQLRTDMDNSLVFISDEELLRGFNELRSNLTTLGVAVDRKDYAAAQSLALAFNTRLDMLHSRTGANIAEYYLLLDLRLNVSRTLDLLGDVELTDTQAAQLADLQGRYAASEMPAPLPRALADQMKTDLLDQQSKSNALFISAERASITSQISALRASVSNLTALSSRNRQKNNFTQVLQELDEAQAALGRNELEKAGSLVEGASARIAQEERDLRKKAGLIELAKADIDAAQEAMDKAEATHFTLLQPDLREAEAALADARTLLYTDPAAAGVEAMGVPDLANSAVEHAYSYDQLATIGAVLLGIIVIVAMLYWIYRREEQ